MAVLAVVALLYLNVQAADDAMVSRLFVGKNADGQLEVFAVDDQGELRHRWQKLSTGDWSAWSSLGGGVLPAIAIVNDAEGRLNIFAVDRASKSILFIQQQQINSRDWSEWRNLGGTVGAPIAVGQDVDGRLEVFAQDAASHRLKHLWQTNTGGEWSAWSTVPTSAVVEDMVVARNKDGRLELFAVQSSQSTVQSELGHFSQRRANRSEDWSDWSNLGGAVLPGLATGLNAAGQLEVFAVNATNGAVNRIIETNASDSGSWSGWVDFEGNMKPGLTAGRCGDDRLEVMGVDAASGALLHRWETLVDGSDKWSGWASLGAAARPYPAVIANEDGDLEVFVEDPDEPGVINHRQQISSASDWLDWGSLDSTTFQYESRTWHSDEGLPDNLVQAIAQTPDGYLWVGTRAGLAQFDGDQFLTYNSRNTSQLGNSSITALCSDHNGTLWIGTDGGGLVSYRDGIFTPLSSTNGLAGDEVRVIYESKDHSLWVGTTKGMSQYKDGHFRNYTHADGLLSDAVNYICEDRDGNLWIATGKGLNRLRQGGAMDQFNMPIFNGLPNDSVRGICQDKGTRVWIGSNNGLLWYSQYWQNTFYAYNTRYGLSDSFVSAICEDKEGNLWVGTYSGLNRFRDGRFINQLDNEGLPFDHVNALFEDREGDLWVGSKEGLIRLTPKRFVAYTKQQGLTHNNTMSVLEDRAGTMWIGTWGGGLDELKDDRVTAYASTNVSQDLILSLCLGHDGSIWAGADFDGGLMRLKNGKLTHYNLTNELGEAGIRVLCEDRNGDLWIGTSRGLGCLSDGQFSSDARDAVRAIYEDHAGNLWFGTENGLECNQKDKWTRFTTQDGLSDDTVTAIYEDKDNVLWLGTAKGGLDRLRDGRFTAYTTRQGLFSDEIFSIVEDDEGWLWMSCSKGVFRVRKKDFEDLDTKHADMLTSIAYGKSDGMESPQCNGGGKPAAWKSRDGRLWFPTTKGVVAVDPKSIKVDHMPPPVYVEELIVDKKPQFLPATEKVAEAPLKLGPGRGELEFHYAALSLVAPERNRFKYKLDGSDTDWIDAGSRRTAYYNNLSPGHYVFHVIACNKDGAWNAIGATVIFDFRPHYWQTWWFRTLLALLVIGSASGTALYATRRKMQRKLQLLEQRHAIEKERGRIAKDIHDDLGSSLTRIMMLGERVEEGLGKREDIGPHVSKIVASARHTVQSLDEIVWAVNPENDTLNGLLAYIGHYANEFFENSDVNCRLELPVELPPVNLVAETRHNLFLIVKEALNNALKHSGATAVRVEVSAKNGAVQILVEDNGHGFDVNAAGNGRGGNGLENMRKRIEHLGGQFEISSAPERGTSLKFVLALTRNDSVKTTDGHG